MARRHRVFSELKRLRSSTWFKILPAAIAIIAIFIGIGLTQGHNTPTKTETLKSQSVSTITSDPTKACTKDCSSSVRSINNPTISTKAKISTSSLPAATTVTAISPPLAYTGQNQQLDCSSFYSNLKYQYNQAIEGLAANLGTSESQGVSEALQQGWSYSELINLINQDIDNANSSIKSDWTSSFVTSLTSQCDSSPSVKLLQVPECTATGIVSVASCLTQINSGLGL